MCYDLLSHRNATLLRTGEKTKGPHLTEQPSGGPLGCQETDSSLPQFRSSSFPNPAALLSAKFRSHPVRLPLACGRGFPWFRSRLVLMQETQERAEASHSSRDCLAWLVVATNNCFSPHFVLSVTVIVIHSSGAADDLYTWSGKSCPPGTNLRKCPVLFGYLWPAPLFSLQDGLFRHFFTPWCIDCHPWNVARFDMLFNLTSFFFSFLFLEQRQS